MKKLLLAIACVVLLVTPTIQIADAHHESYQRRFLRGDANFDGVINISDGQRIVDFLFLGTCCPWWCFEGLNVNADEFIDLSDAVYLFSFLFGGGPDIPPPVCSPFVHDFFLDVSCQCQINECD